MKVSKKAVVAGAAIGITALVTARVVKRLRAPLTTVPGVDLKRYAGKWYEIARVPFLFERQCEGDVTAHYHLDLSGGVKILNQCRKADGMVTRQAGTATPVDGTNSRWRLEYIWPFSAEYCIIDLADDYSHAMVGAPGRTHLWILSRTPQMDRTTYERLAGVAQAMGFKTARLRKTHQSQAEPVNESELTAIPRA